MAGYVQEPGHFSIEGEEGDLGLQEGTLVRMFEQALKVIHSLPEDARPALLARLDAVRRTSHNFGYGVGDDMDDLLAEYGILRPQ